MSNRLVHFYRDRWPGERLSEADLTALGAAPKVRAPRLMRLLSRSTGVSDPLESLEVALLTQNVQWDAPLNPAVELSGRGYARPLVGPLVVSGPGPWKWTNQRLILFPQAKTDWGLAYYVALLQVGIDSVLATAPIAAPPFPIIAEDQPRIPPKSLTIGGVLPNTKRPYGAGRYGESLYGGWPDAGAVFFAVLNEIGYEWASLPNACSPWTDLQLFSGGCSA
jgi:hypothetical protein